MADPADAERRRPVRPRSPSRSRIALPPVLALAWLLAALGTLAGQPIAGGEADLLLQSGTGGPLWSASPLGAFILRLVALAGPPAEQLHRVVGLLGLGLLVVVGHRVASALAGARRAGALAVLCLGAHGALLLGASQVAPAAWVPGAEALVLLAALAAAEGDGALRCGAVGVAATLVVALEPATLPLPLAAAAWLGWVAGRPVAAAVTAAAPMTLLAGLAAGGLSPLSGLHGWPEELAAFASPLAGQLLCVGVGEGLHDRVIHPAMGVAAPGYAAALVGVAAVGLVRSWRRRGGGERPIAEGATGAALLTGGLLLASVATVVVRGPGQGPSCVGFVLLPPLMILASAVTARIARGPDALVWAALLVGSSWFTGAFVLATSRHEETRAAARALAEDERIITPDPSLRRAIELYRQPPPPEGRRRRAQVWRPGDERPRLVAVHAFGERLGRLWLLRPAAPLHDLGRRLQHAEVTYRSRDELVSCPWDPDRTRFSCGGPEYQYVAQSGASFAGVEAAAIYAHPLDDGVLEIRWRDVPTGQRLVGLAGLDDASIDFSSSEVRVEVRVGEGPPLVLRRGDRRGLLPFEIDTRGAPERADVSLRISAADDRGRHLFVDAVTVE